MTHDKLLAKIEVAVDVEYFKESWLALRAVVEITQMKNPAPISPAFGDGWRTAMMTVFDAIEKELK
jgi:hypothetical protein